MPTWLLPFVNSNRFPTHSNSLVVMDALPAVVSVVVVGHVFVLVVPVTVPVVVVVVAVDVGSWDVGSQ